MKIQQVRQFTKLIISGTGTSLGLRHTGKLYLNKRNWTREQHRFPPFKIYKKKKHNFKTKLEITEKFLSTF